jgi:hypothetical protein
MWGKHISRWPHNYFLFMANKKLCIPLNVWWNNTKCFKIMRYIWWASLQMSYGHEEWDVKYFLNNWTKFSFTKVIHDLHKVNLEAWRTIKHVCTLMWSSYNWTPPKNIIKWNHRLFIIGAYEIWCNLYELSKVTCFGVVKKFCQWISCVIDYLSNLNSIKLFVECD